MWDVHTFLQDEKPLVDQLVNLENGSLSLDTIKIPLGASWYLEKDGTLYSVYSHAVPALAVPVYLMLYLISRFMNIAAFFILLWSALIVLVGYSLARKFDNYNVLRLCTGVSLLLMGVNFSLYRPVSFDAWGELISMQFFNITITSIAAVLVYQLFKSMFGEKLGLFSAVVFLFATPYSFWGVGVKEHALSVFLSLASFFFFYNYLTTRKSSWVYAAYFLSGIVAWGRIFDALPLFFALYVTDIFFVKGFFNGNPRLIQHVKPFFKYSAGIFIVMVVALLPYFVNNYLVIGNPFFFIGYSGYSPGSVMAPGKMSGIEYSLNALKTLGEIPSFSRQYWGILGLDTVAISVFRLFYYSGVPFKSSVFQVNPLLSVVLPVSAVFALRLIRECKERKNSLLNSIRASSGSMDVFFAIFVVLIFIFYIPFNYVNSDGYSYDFRYFILFYIPLTYYTIKALNALFPSYVEANLSDILRLFFIASYLTFFSSILLLYLFYPPGFLSVISLTKAASLIYISISAVYVVAYAKKQGYLKYVISMCLSLSFFWLFMADVLGRGDAYGRGVSMMLPVFEYVREFLRLLLATSLLR